MKTYKVLLKVTGANGEPIALEVKGDSHAFTDGDTLTVMQKGEIAAVFPSGAYAALQISPD